MATQTYEYTAEEAIVLEACRNAAAGDLLDVNLDTDSFPLLPSSIRAVIQLVDGLTYTLQYEDTDLNGGAASLNESIIVSVTVVTELTRAQEYADSLVAERDVTIADIQAALINLGVLPQAGDNLFVVEGTNYEHVSVPVYLTQKGTAISGGGLAAFTVDSEVHGEALGLPDIESYTFRIDIDISVVSQANTDGLHSSYRYVYIGKWDEGGVIDTVFSNIREEVAVTATKVGNDIHVSVVNSNPDDGMDIFVASKFQTLDYNP